MSLAGKNIFVTGGLGFIGGSLALTQEGKVSILQDQSGPSMLQFGQAHP